MRRDRDTDVSVRTVTGDIPIPTERARLILLTGKHAGRIYRFTGEARIGRDPACEVVLEAGDVSRKHARLWLEEDGEWRVEDLQSSNGTQVNGVPLVGRTQLRFGNRLQVGHSQLFIFTHHDHLEEQVLQLQKLESIGQLAGEVAHDFRNMVNAVRSNIELVEAALDEDSLTEEDLRECLEDMTRATSRAEGLTSKLLGFARRGRSETRPVNLSDVIIEVVKLCRRTFPDRIEVDDDIEENLALLGDVTQLHQVVMNLLINARDALDGSGRVYIAAERVDLEQLGAYQVPVPAPGSYIAITVADNGVGMSDEVRTRVFEPFFTTKPENKGTGLGLATVYAVVKNHGGHVLLESILNEGSTFRVFLPALDDIPPSETGSD
jgi:signal transduction histidine kinase